MQKLDEHGIQILEDSDEDSDQVLMKINKHCEDVYSYLKPFSFKLEKTQININPIGYTYMISEQ